MRPTRRELLWLGGFNLLRLGFALTFDLTPQEAYYFFYSRHLALSYFDHPPAIAVMLRLFTELLGPHPLSLRLCAFTQSLVLQWGFFQLAKRCLPSARRGDALLLFASTGVVTLVTLISLPDVPLLMFWTLSVWQLHRALFDERRDAWLWAGLFMGLAFDSKYTGLLLQLGLVLFLVVSAAHRKWLKTPWPWLAVALAQVVMAPVYVWNAQHHFASFLFQSRDRAGTGFHPTLRYFGALLGTQAALVGPVLLVALALVWRNLRSDRPQRLFLAAFSLPLFALCFTLSLGMLVKPNWMLPCYVTGLLLVAEQLPERWRKLTFVATALLHLLAAVELLFYPVRIQSDDTWAGWKDAAAEAAKRAAEHPGAFLFAADQYKTSAEFLFYQPQKVYGPNVIGQRGLEFDYVDTDLSALLHRDALYFKSTPRDVTPGRSGATPAALLPSFAACTEEEPLLVRRGERVLRKFLVYACRDYRGAAPRQ